MESPTLVSVESIRERGSLADVVDLNDRVHEANKVTSRRLANQVRTEFTRRAITDRFTVINNHEILPGPLVKLKLSQGFVDGAQTITVNKGNTVRTLRLGEGTEIDSAEYDVDLEKGIVEIEATSIIFPGALEVIYTAGFTTTTQEPYGEFYDAALVPEWLAEAAIQWGLQTYDWLGDPKRETRKLEKELEFGLIHGHIRYFGDTVDVAQSI